MPTRVSIVSNTDETVAASVTAKGTQGANALPVQDLKDSGRTMRSFGATFTPATTEAMITLTPVTAGVTGTAGTSFTITANKTLRLQAMSVNTADSATTAVGLQANLRVNPAGAVLSSSPLLFSLGNGQIGTQVISSAAGTAVSFPDGLEFSGIFQIGVSAVGIATANATITLIGFEY